MVLLVDFGKVLYFSVNKCKQNSNASFIEEYNLSIVTFSGRFISFTFDLCGLLSFDCHS